MAHPKIVNSITRGTDILKGLSYGIDRISDISDKLRLSKSTVFRLLKSFEVSGLVIQDPITRRYYLGPLVLELASKPIISHQNLIVCAYEDMRYLRDLSRETVVLYIRMGIERICLEEFQGLENIRYNAGKGVAVPVYTGSAGKVLLSELKDNELQLILKNIRLESLGPNTITDKGKLFKELKKVRNQGYATSFGERIARSASISVPIKNYICPVALGLLGPDNRFSLKVMMGILEEIKKSASRISRKLIEANQRRG